MPPGRPFQQLRRGLFRHCSPFHAPAMTPRMRVYIKRESLLDATIITAQHHITLHVPKMAVRIAESSPKVMQWCRTMLLGDCGICHSFRGILLSCLRSRSAADRFSPRSRNKPRPQEPRLSARPNTRNMWAVGGTADGPKSGPGSDFRFRPNVRDKPQCLLFGFQPALSQALTPYQAIPFASKAITAAPPLGTRTVSPASIGLPSGISTRAVAAACTTSIVLHRPGRPRGFARLQWHAHVLAAVIEVATRIPPRGPRRARPARAARRKPAAQSRQVAHQPVDAPQARRRRRGRPAISAAKLDPDRRIRRRPPAAPNHGQRGQAGVVTIVLASTTSARRRRCRSLAAPPAPRGGRHRPRRRRPLPGPRKARRLCSSWMIRYDSPVGYAHAANSASSGLPFPRSTKDRTPPAST